jgi:hypothetical protein
MRGSRAYTDFGLRRQRFLIEVPICLSERRANAAVCSPGHLVRQVIPRDRAFGRAGRIRESKRKQTKIKVSKIAFFYFLLLTFIFSKRDFSTSYGRVKQKNLFPLVIPAPDVLSVPDCRAMLGREQCDPDRRDDIAWIADFLKQLRRAWAKTGRR